MHFVHRKPRRGLRYDILRSDRSRRSGLNGIENFILYQGTVQKFVVSLSELGSNNGQLRDNNQYLEKTFAYLNMTKTGKEAKRVEKQNIDN